MKINPDFLAPCGLYCGVCAVYYATRERNEKFKEKSWLAFIRESSQELKISLQMISNARDAFQTIHSGFVSRVP